MSHAVVAELILLAVVAISAATDVRSGKIYNLVTYPAIAAGVFVAALAGPEALRSSIVGFAVGFLPFLLLFGARLINGGDVKLLGAVGALGGYPFILHAIFLSFLVASAMGVAKLVWKGELWPALRDIGASAVSVAVPGAVPRRPTPRGTVPFGVAAMIGCAWAAWAGRAPF